MISPTSTSSRSPHGTLRRSWAGEAARDDRGREAGGPDRRGGRRRRRARASLHVRRARRRTVSSSTGFRATVPAGLFGDFGRLRLLQRRARLRVEPVSSILSTTPAIPTSAASTLAEATELLTDGLKRLPELAKDMVERPKLDPDVTFLVLDHEDDEGVDMRPHLPGPSGELTAMADGRLAVSTPLEDLLQPLDARPADGGRRRSLRGHAGQGEEPAEGGCRPCLRPLRPWLGVGERRRPPLIRISRTPKASPKARPNVPK